MNNGPLSFIENQILFGRNCPGGIVAVELVVNVVDSRRPPLTRYAFWNNRQVCICMQD